MAAFLPIAVLISLLAAGATADGYGSSPSPSTPPPHTPPPAPYTPPPAHGDGDKKKLVVVHVEGLVLCQSCAKRGSPSLDGAAALPGARVTVTCRDRKNRVMTWRCPVADYNGYFHAEFSVEPTSDFFGNDPREACFVRLLSSKDAKCNVVTNINGGMGGALLRDEGKRWTNRYGIENVMYAAGPLAFRPKMCAPTRHY
ncbi:hypothetical protein SEVIR_5G111000v4 [Setaria viridis]|uniref:Uncharacterized protein n=1 Tax=Setaria viridis TaxID=4556 RepID=A0A4V6D6A0_SETVI|nr:hypothetical protein SEVIR_5G111000v2 [Setaria viridis]